MSQTPSTDPRRIEYLPLTELQEDPRNPKSHALEAVSSSVGRFGFIEPVVRDERTGYIISGHGRTKVLTAMQERGDTPPNGVQVGEDGAWRVPVVVGWSSRTDLDASGALIALNRTTELGGWVDDALLDLLDDLTEDDEYGLDGVGYGTDDLEELTARLDKLPNFQPETDDMFGGGGSGNGGDVRLDRKSVTDCPSCGHTFTPTTRSVIDEEESGSEA